MGPNRADLQHGDGVARSIKTYVKLGQSLWSISEHSNHTESWCDHSEKTESGQACFKSLLSYSRDNERQRLQRRQWKVHFSRRYSHNARLFILNTLFSMAQLQNRRIFLIFQKFCRVYSSQQKLWWFFFPEDKLQGWKLEHNPAHLADNFLGDICIPCGAAPRHKITSCPQAITPLRRVCSI